MKVKSKVFKRRTGKSTGKWIVRIEYFDEIAGRNKFIERHADKRSEAVDKRDRLIDDVRKSYGQMQTGERMTFNQLADICEKIFYGEAQIHEGKKISGARSARAVKSQIKSLREFFGKRLIKEITTESLTDYKLWRLKKKSDDSERTIKIATVNRALSAMRKMMRFAYGKGWIFKDIFFNAKIIDASGEIERKRLLTTAEETRLLASCHGEREVTYRRKLRGVEQEVTAKIKVDFPHLRSMIILALDSGLRCGEIFKLKWSDIDFDNNLIHILSTNTKTERARIAPLSERAKEELENIKSISDGGNPFPVTDFKRSFKTIKEMAKIDDLHFHDLRRTAITRWVGQGTDLAIAGKLAGHTQLKTTLKHYIAADEEAVSRVAEKMNEFHKQANKPQIVSELNN